MIKDENPLIMDEHKQKLIEAAEHLMIVLFSDGKVRQPSDLDDEVLGGPDRDFWFSIPRWNQTIFCTAMGNLVEKGNIVFWLDEDENYYYQKKAKALTYEEVVAFNDQIEEGYPKELDPNDPYVVRPLEILKKLLDAESIINNEISKNHGNV